MVNIYSIHPFFGALFILFVYMNAYMGISRLTRKSFRFNRELHIKIGKTAFLTFYLAYLLGLLGMNDAGYPIYSTPHSYLDSVILPIFTLGVILALLMLRGRRVFVKAHGRVMVFVTFLLIFQALGGVGNLIGLRLI